MKRYILAALAALIATPAAAVTLADLEATCVYELPSPRFDRYNAKNCPTNVWYVCRDGSSICCDTASGTTVLKLQ